MRDYKNYTAKPPHFTQTIAFNALILLVVLLIMGWIGEQDKRDEFNKVQKVRCL